MVLFAICIMGVQLLLNTSTTITRTSTSTAAAGGDSIHNNNKKTAVNKEYIPAPVEQYFMDNMVTLGYDKEDNPMTCNVWKDPKATNSTIYNMLQSYASDLDNYQKAIQNFKRIPNIMNKIKRSSSNEDNENICKELRLHPDGLQGGIFSSTQLSYSRSGYVEPLLPPMRSHKLCFDRSALLKLDYLVHDFEAMCQKLKPTSRIILIDMGASLDFHEENQPIMELIKLYQKFGFKFDHIYAFEVTPKDPNHVFNQVPKEFIPSYHWFNVGVSQEKSSKRNPLHSLLKTFHEDDLVIVKLDIDTSSIELPLAKQLLKDEDGIYSKIVDQFYFEHHVHLGELANDWGRSKKGSIQDSFDLFHGLRKRGIPAHFWP
jgi:hypothetical protein